MYELDSIYVRAISWYVVGTKYLMWPTTVRNKCRKNKSYRKSR